MKYKEEKEKGTLDEKRNRRISLTVSRRSKFRERRESNEGVRGGRVGEEEVVNAGGREEEHEVTGREGR